MGVIFGIMIMTLGGVAAAQTGYYPIEDLGIFSEGDLEVDVDLQSAMLQVAAGALEAENPDMAKMVTGLERIRVQVGTPSGVDKATINNAFDNAISGLEGAGWNKILSVMEDDEQVFLFGLESGGTINGLTALVNDGGEDIVVVNIVGVIDPVVLGRLIANLDEMPDLDGLLKVDY